METGSRPVFLLLLHFKLKVHTHGQRARKPTHTVIRVTRNTISVQVWMESSGRNPMLGSRCDCGRFGGSSASSARQVGLLV